MPSARLRAYVSELPSQAAEARNDRHHGFGDQSLPLLIESHAEFLRRHADDDGQCAANDIGLRHQRAGIARCGLCGEADRKTRRNAARKITSSCAPLASTIAASADHVDRVLVYLHQSRRGALAWAATETWGMVKRSRRNNSSFALEYSCREPGIGSNAGNLNTSVPGCHAAADPTSSTTMAPSGRNFPRNHGPGVALLTTTMTGGQTFFS